MITIEFYGRLKGDFKTAQLDWPDSQHNLTEIFGALCETHAVNVDTNIIRPILNDSFCDWQSVPQTGDVVGFFPPASGG